MPKLIKRTVVEEYVEENTKGTEAEDEDEQEDVEEEEDSDDEPAPSSRKR